MERRFKAVTDLGEYKRGDDVPESEVTDQDLLFNRVVPYNYSAPPPQIDKETPPPHLPAVLAKTSNTTVREE